MSSFIEQQNNLSTEELVDGPEKSYHKKNDFFRYTRTKLFKGILFVFFFSLFVPVLIFFFAVQLGYSVTVETNTCLVEYSYRVPCGEKNITENVCKSVYCCYDEETDQCYHYLPSVYAYYRSNLSDAEVIYLPNQTETTFGSASKEQLSASVIEIDENKVQIVLHESYETYDEVRIENKNYNVTVFNDSLYVEIYRVLTGETLLTTSKGSLMASDGYWEWSFQLTSEKLFGLGEITFMENVTYTKVIYKNRNDHNTLPIFMAYKNGSFHGAVVQHDGPLEVTVLPSFLVIVRWLVGDYLSITLCTGPKPVDVVNQLRMEEPVVPPYWALGPHICR